MNMKNYEPNIIADDQSSLYTLIVSYRMIFYRYTYKHQIMALYLNFTYMFIIFYIIPSIISSIFGPGPTH